MGRHSRSPRGPGPVTRASQVMAMEPRRKTSSVALRVWPAVPVLGLVYPAMHGTLIRYADTVIGYDAVLCLLACLAVTPIITVAKMPIAKLRWWYGNWVFFLGAAGLALHLSHPPGSLAYRATGSSVDWSGTLIIVLLLPMAATSSVMAQRLLGPEWKRWQRGLVWAVWAAVLGHLLLMSAWLALGAYVAVSLPAILVRQQWARRGIKAWRAGGYATGGWWAALAILSVLALTGAFVLATAEVGSVVRAITAR